MWHEPVNSLNQQTLSPWIDLTPALNLSDGRPLQSGCVLRVCYTSAPIESCHRPDGPPRGGCRSSRGHSGPVAESGAFLAFVGSGELFAFTRTPIRRQLRCSHETLLRTRWLHLGEIGFRSMRLHI